MERHMVEKKMSELLDKAEELGFTLSSARTDADPISTMGVLQIDCRWRIDLNLEIQ